MMADLNVIGPQRAGPHLHAAAGLMLLHEAHGIRQLLIEAAVDVQHQDRGDSKSIELAGVDHGLHGDVGRRLHLKVAPPRLRGEIGRRARSISTGRVSWSSMR